MMPSPLHGPAPTEIPLARAPLVRVIAQVRFSTILMIATPEAIAPLQERLRREYPGLRRQEGQNVTVDVTPEGPTFRTEQTTLWRFLDAAEDWIATLAVDAITLETRTYVSRIDFTRRLGDLVEALADVFAPASAERVSVRYVSRVERDEYACIEELVRRELLGLALPALRDDVRSAISEAAMTADEGEVLLRWGMVPEGGTVDPTVLPPVEGKSWVVDVDVGSGTGVAFGRDVVAGVFASLAQRAYAVFRYVVTDRFLETYGAPS